MLNNTDDIKNAENKNMENMKNKPDVATIASAETIENQSEVKQPTQKSNKDGDIKIKKTGNIQRDVEKDIELSDSISSEKKTEAKTMTDSSEKKVTPPNEEDKQSSTSSPLEENERRTTVREGRKSYAGRATSTVSSSREAGSPSVSSGGKSNIRHSRGFRPRYRRQPLDTRDLKIDFLHPEVLQRFISRTGKILPQRVTGAKPAVQRKIAREIKRARHIGLLPYTHR